jgi:hypothetical protein
VPPDEVEDEELLPGQLQGSYPFPSAWHTWTPMVLPGQAQAICWPGAQTSGVHPAQAAEPSRAPRADTWRLEGDISVSSAREAYVIGCTGRLPDSRPVGSSSVLCHPARAPFVRVHVLSSGGGRNALRIRRPRDRRRQRSRARAARALLHSTTVRARSHRGAGGRPHRVPRQDGAPRALGKKVRALFVRG